jgi:glycosyltransferase involved in cell wall biosynthesis
MLGQIEAESAEIVALAKELLEADKFKIKTVASDQVVDYYQVADAFVLASLGEGLPRVLLEAMSYGLPCITHDYAVSRFVLKDEGYFGNFELAGSLTSLISDVLSQNNDNSKLRRHQSVYERFSWDKIHDNYVMMLQKSIKK